MSKEQIVLFYSVLIILLFVVFTFFIYLKNKRIESLRLKIEELDEIYFDEISELEKIISKERKGTDKINLNLLQNNNIN